MIYSSFQQRHTQKITPAHEKVLTLKNPVRNLEKKKIQNIKPRKILRKVTIFHEI